MFLTLALSPLLRSSCGTSARDGRWSSTKDTTTSTPTCLFTCVSKRGCCSQVFTSIPVNTPLISSDLQTMESPAINIHHMSCCYRNNTFSISVRYINKFCINHRHPGFLSITMSVCCLQWVRTATPVCGVFKTAISSGPSPRLILQERTPSLMWSSPHSWVDAEDCLASWWLSVTTSITTLMVTIRAGWHPSHKVKALHTHTHTLTSAVTMHHLHSYEWFTFEPERWTFHHKGSWIQYDLLIFTVTF